MKTDVRRAVSFFGKTNTAKPPRKTNGLVHLKMEVNPFEKGKNHLPSTSILRFKKMFSP